MSTPTGRQHQGATVKDVTPQDFIVTLALHFKKSQKLELPEWHDIVKTGKAKELAPANPDWYYIRAASIVRKIYLKGGLGAGAFSTIYGSQDRRNNHRPHHAKASRGLIRHILNQLAKADLVAYKEKSSGRYITAAGRRELDTIASQVVKSAKMNDYTAITRGTQQ